MSKTAVILIAEGTEEIEAITPGDVLSRAGVNVTYAGVGTTTPTGGHGVPLRAEMLVEDLGHIRFDAIVVPGGALGAQHIAHCEHACTLILEHAQAGKIVAGICAAPAVVLAPLGLLDGRHATCYPGMESRFPPSVARSHGSIALDGNILTSRGPGTAIDFSLRLAELLTDTRTAHAVAHKMLVTGH